MPSTYQQVPYTLDPTVAIPDETPLSSGLTEADADAIVALSAAYATEEITLTLTAGAPPSKAITAAVKLEAAAPPAHWRTVLNWGDGTQKLAAAPGTDTHTYDNYGTYRVEVAIERPYLNASTPGAPSMFRAGYVTVKAS